jgi:hypothetical protein
MRTVKVLNNLTIKHHLEDTNRACHLKNRWLKLSSRKIKQLKSYLSKLIKKLETKEHRSMKYQGIQTTRTCGSKSWIFVTVIQVMPANLDLILRPKRGLSEVKTAFTRRLSTPNKCSYLITNHIGTLELTLKINSI